MKPPTTEYRDIRATGESHLDEASRALLNLCWIAGCLRGIAEREAQHAGNPCLIEDPDMTDVEPPQFVSESAVIHRQHVAEVREWWPRWTEAVERVFAALSAVKWRTINMDPERAYQIATEWRTWFPDPIFIHASELPGDHLFRAAGPLRADKNRGPNLDLGRFAEMIREMEQIAQRLRLLSSFHVADDLRNSRWYSKVTKKGVNSQILRQAHKDGKLPGARKPRDRWLFPISEVVRAFPEYQKVIRKAEADDES